jgi:HD-GYP domain-containing protein (c-di-GMP phosphodiesterase class II)
MPYTTLAAVKQRLVVGQPLPFGVRDDEYALLLAKGQVIATEEQLQALMDRGALVDIDDLLTARERARHAAKEALPRLWDDGLGRVNKALQNLQGGQFTDALDDASDAVLGLVERDPNLAIFQVLTRDPDTKVLYGVRRSMHAAITSYLVGHRLGWDASTLARVFKVGLTMNLSMLELQGELARQRTAPTASQRADLMTHPMRSVELLMQAGIRDDDWLQAVARHHEQEDGSGYPTGRRDVGDLASLVRRADVYTAKLASRVHRDALLADQAGRQMFMQDPGHPMTAALVKEFGIYPPGSYVRLASGETGVVVQRGPTVTTPVVACLTSARGTALTTPLRVDTAIARHAIQCVVGEGSVGHKLPLDKLISTLN